MKIELDDRTTIDEETIEVGTVFRDGDGQVFMKTDEKDDEGYTLYVDLEDGRIWRTVTHPIVILDVKLVAASAGKGRS